MLGGGEEKGRPDTIQAALGPWWGSVGLRGEVKARKGGPVSRRGYNPLGVFPSPVAKKKPTLFWEGIGRGREGQGKGGGLLLSSKDTGPGGVKRGGGFRGNPYTEGCPIGPRRRMRQTKKKGKRRKRFRMKTPVFQGQLGGKQWGNEIRSKKGLLRR